MSKIESGTLMLYWKKNTNWNSRDKTTMSEIKNILLDMMPDFEDFLSFPALLLISCNTF